MAFPDVEALLGTFSSASRELKLGPKALHGQLIILDNCSNILTIRLQRQLDVVRLIPTAKHLISAVDLSREIAKSKYVLCRTDRRKARRARLPTLTG